MATITKRKGKDGEITYHARVRRLDYDTVCMRFDTKRQAQDWAAGVENLMAESRYVVDKHSRRVTLEQVIDEYLKRRVPNLKGRQPKYETVDWKKRPLAKRTIGKITVADIIEWIDERSDEWVGLYRRDMRGRILYGRNGKPLPGLRPRKIRPKTVLNELTRLSAIFTWAQSELEMHALVNPVKLVPDGRRPKAKGRDRRLKRGELNQLLQAAKPNALLQQWMDWLDTLRTYVRSLEPGPRSTLKRVVITSGQWLVVFRNPVASLVMDAKPDPADIRCFVSFEDLQDRYRELYRLLARPRLVNTLPLVFDLPEALAFFVPAAIDAFFRGVVVTTRLSGAERSPYPTRTVYPALVVVSGGRSFAVADFGGDQLEEPRKVENLAGFLEALEDRGAQFQARVLARLNRADLEATALGAYPADIRDAADNGDEDEALPRSTAALAAANTPDRPQLVRIVGSRPSDKTFLVITGDAWFHKRLQPFGPECAFHSFIEARNQPRGSAQDRRYWR